MSVTLTQRPCDPSRLEDALAWLLARCGVGPGGAVAGAGAVGLVGGQGQGTRARLALAAARLSGLRPRGKDPKAKKKPGKKVINSRVET